MQQEHNELKAKITAKTIEFEAAFEADRPREELLGIYKELKELQFQKVQNEIGELVTK